MTKRLLSLIMAVALIATLFTGVAFAATAVAPQIVPTEAHVPHDGPMRITINGKTTTGPGITETIYYRMGDSASVPDPTDSDDKYIDSFVVSKAGKYWIKATAYVYDASTGKTTKATSGAVDFTVGGSAVTKIEINQKTPSIAGSGSFTFTATVTPESAKKDLRWVITDENNLKGSAKQDWKLLESKDTDGTFKVTSRGGVGSFKVNVATAGSLAYFYNTVSVPVPAVNSTRVEVPTTITVAQYESLQFEGSVVPANATYQRITVDSFTPQYASITNDGVNYANGANTFTVSGLAKGEQMFNLYATDYVNSTTSPAYEKKGASRNVKVIVTDAGTIAPKPAFSAASGKVFTEPDAKVTIIPNYTAAALLKTEYSIDYGANWNTYVDTTVPYPIPNNGSVDIWIRNVPDKASSSKYEVDSDIVRATFKSEIAAETITLDKTSPQTIKGSASFDVEATVKGKNNADPFDESVTFTSDKPSVAKVEYAKNDTKKIKATVTGVSQGTANITVASADGKAKVTLVVNVDNVDPDRVKLYEADGTTPLGTLTVNKGEYVKVVAKVVDNQDELAFDQSATWSVVTGNSVTVTNGRIVGVSTGKSTVRVTSAKYPALSAQFEVEVYPEPPQVANLTVTPAKALWANPFTSEQTVTIETATDGAAIYYTLDGSDPATSSTRIAYVEGGFKLSGPAKGTLKIVATKGTLKAATESIDFQFNIAVTKITMDATATVAKGETLQMKAVITPDNATNKKITWGLITSDRDMASIDVTTGVLTAKKAGIVTVTATSATTGVTPARCVVTITEAPVATLEIFPEKLEMNILDTQQLQFRATRLAKTIDGGNWTSSDTKVATVGATSGIVSAVAEGKATITLTYGGMTATCEVSVLADPVDIPAPAGSPTYKATVKEFTAVEKGTLSAVVGKITPADGETLEQMFYYYDFNVTADGMPDANKGDFTFVIGKDGTITMYVANVPETSFYLSYTVSATNKAGRTGAAGFASVTVSDNMFTVTPEPIVIKITDEKIEDQSMKPTDTLTLSKIATVTNLADLKTKGYTLTATGVVRVKDDNGFTDVPLPNPWAITMDDTTGVISLVVTEPAEGDYEVNALVQGVKPGVATIEARTAVIKFFVYDDTVIELKASVGYDYNVAGVMFISKSDPNFTFSVPGMTVTSWKSAKPKIISVDATTGAAELKGKKGKKAAITATFSDGKTLKTTVQIAPKMDDQMIVKYKAPGKKKFVDFTDNKIDINVGDKATFKMTGKHGPKGLVSWSYGTSKAIGIKINFKKRTCVVTGLDAGTATLTVADFRGTKQDITINVGTNAPAVKEILKSRKVVTDVVIK